VHKAENKYLRRPLNKNDDIAINIWEIVGFIDEKAFENRSSFSLELIEHYRNEILKIHINDSELWETFG
jgi:hypothetical protein